MTITYRSETFQCLAFDESNEMVDDPESEYPKIVIILGQFEESDITQSHLTFQPIEVLLEYYIHMELSRFSKIMDYTRSMIDYTKPSGSNDLYIYIYIYINYMY